ncbi:hypothetical protein [Haloarchaeobius sp. TZWSO28]|uniref:hypothetical protein n=1 Tax=Haloarchaeobius sp. TZWSO28 TaxID=3446119 RepID=UPI003EBE6183
MNLSRFWGWRHPEYRKYYVLTILVTGGPLYLVSRDTGLVAVAVFVNALVWFVVDQVT